MPRVFIGMIAYNGERFIKEAIDSLLSQSFSDVKLFISDDASTDGTQKICEEYAKKDPRVVYYRQPKNTGMFPNFKFVLEKADGEYFMWASHDDLWEKDFIKTCIENIERQNVDAANTAILVVDGHGRQIFEHPEMTKLSGKPSVRSIIIYTLQPECLGKCNLMYSVFKTDVAKKLWKIYPQRMEWGSDYFFSAAIIGHFNVFVDEKYLFKKRLGGFSNPNSLNNEREDTEERINIKNPKNRMFPFGRFHHCIRGYTEALAGTGYGPLAKFLLYLRLPRAFAIYLTERNYKKFFKRLMANIP